MTERDMTRLVAAALGISPEEAERLAGLDGEAFVAALELQKKQAAREVLAGIWDHLRTIDFIDDPAPTPAQRDALEERLRRAQRMEAMGALSSVVSHDFNNHLTTITGFTDLILKSLPEADPLRGRLTMVRKAAEQAAEMTRQLMVIGNRQPTDPVDMSLSEVVWEMESMLKRLVGRKVALEVKAARDLRVARLDRALIEQVLVTLANRARSIMSGGGRLMIETRNLDLDDVGAALEREVPVGPWVVLSITDTGPSLDEAARAGLFEPFIDAHGKRRGSLAMSMVYGIVRQLQGYLSTYSEPGQGLTLKFYFPPSGGQVRRPLAADRAAAELRGGDETVLLVEDEEPLRRLGRDLLQAAGYQVLEATDGGHALLVCERHDGPIALMVTDFNLPTLNGRQLYDRIHPLRPEMRVLFTSGHNSGAVLGSGADAAGFEFLPKPYSAETLLGAVRGVLDRKAA